MIGSIEWMFQQFKAVTLCCIWSPSATADFNCFCPHVSFPNFLLPHLFCLLMLLFCCSTFPWQSCFYKHLQTKVSAEGLIPTCQISSWRLFFLLFFFGVVQFLEAPFKFGTVLEVCELWTVGFQEIKVDCVFRVMLKWGICVTKFLWSFLLQN